MRTLTAIAAAAIALLPGLAVAQDTMRVRGTVEAVAGDVVTMRTVEGETADITMADGYALIVYEPITVGELAPGDFLSIPALPGADGSTVALSINVFPEAMRGVGEGRSPWDAGEGSTMVNATIGTITAIDGGNALTVSYLDDAQDVSVPEGTPITRIVPTPERRLVAGDMTVLSVTMDGEIPTGAFAAVMADGTLPRL